MVETTLTVKNKVGLHARPAALFVKTANDFQSEISVTNLTRQTKPVSAKSILGVLTLSVAQNHTVALTAKGDDAAAAIAALTKLIEDNFGEPESE